MEKIIRVAPWLEEKLTVEINYVESSGKESFFLKSFRKAERMIPQLKNHPKPISRRDKPKPYEHYEKLLTESGFTVNQSFIIYHFEGVSYWRVPYTLTRNEIKEVIMILDVISHDEYNKIFGYLK